MKYLEGGVCANCPKIGLEQHQGECWHDSLATIILFSDDFSENIQKLLTSDFDANTRIKRVSANQELYPKYFLPYNISPTGPDFDKFCEVSKIYLSNLNKLYQNELKPIDKRVDTTNLSITCVAQSYNINNINKISQTKFTKHQHGGNNLDIIINSTIFNYFLREPKNKYIIPNIFILDTITKDNMQLFLKTLSQCTGIYISLNTVETADIPGGHSMGFYQCKNKKYFFDDNGISDDEKDKKTYIEFDWKTYLEDKMKKMIDDSTISYTSMSDFLPKYGKKYLKDFVINALILFTTHEPTTEDMYNKNNLQNFKYLTGFVTPKIIDIFNKYVDDVNIQTRLLYEAAYDNNHVLLKALHTKYKLDLTKIKYNNKSILFYTLYNTSTFNETLKYLIQFNFDLNEVFIDDYNNFNLFLVAVDLNNIEFVKYLLSKNKKLINSVDITNSSGLHLAVEKNNLEMVKLLIENNIDMNILRDNIFHPIV
jgi:hypothetical protein